MYNCPTTQNKTQQNNKNNIKQNPTKQRKQHKTKEENPRLFLFVLLFLSLNWAGGEGVLYPAREKLYLISVYSLVV
jgi:hypothetical protein